MNMGSKTFHINELPIEFYRLPFEATYATLEVTIATLVAETKSPQALSDVAIRVTKGMASDVSFRCQNLNGCELFLVQADELTDFVPDWMQMINPGELHQYSEEYLLLTIKDGEIDLHPSHNDWDEDVYHEISPDLTIYRFMGSCEPDGYIIDPDKEKIQPRLSSDYGKADNDNWQIFCDQLNLTASHALEKLLGASTKDTKHRYANEWMSACQALNQINVAPISLNGFLLLSA